MIAVVRRAGVVMLVTAACCAAARADDGTLLRDKVLTAMATATSFAVDVSNPQGITGTGVVIPPAARAKIAGSAGPQTLVVYAADGYIYEQFNGAAWQRRKFAVSAASLISPIGATATVSPEADQHDATGTTVGAFKALTSLAIPGMGTIPNVQMECTYDKASFVLHACTSQYATFAFRNYNDPKNVVEVPAEAKSAPESPPYGAAAVQAK